MMPGQRGIDQFRSQHGPFFHSRCLLRGCMSAMESPTLRPHMQRMKNSSAPITVKSRRANLALVCRKCLKRADDGKSVKRGLKAELKGRCAKESQRRD